MSDRSKRWAKMAGQLDGAALIARQLDPLLRVHFRHAGSLGTFSLDTRSHTVVPMFLQDVLTCYCHVPEEIAPAVKKELLRLPDNDGFYKTGVFENRSEAQASMTTFWHGLHSAVAEANHPVADAYCGDALDWAVRLCQEQGVMLFRPMDPELAIYRARIVRRASPLRDDAWTAPAESLGAPPPEFAKAQRLNVAGRSMLYGATSAKTCLAELRVHTGWDVVIGRFVAARPLVLFDMTCFEKLRFLDDIFEPEYADRTSWIGILRGLAGEFAQPSWPGDDESTYIAPQYMSAFIAKHAAPKVDGIAYPSAQLPGKQFNVALFEGWTLTRGDQPALKLQPNEPLWARSTSIEIKFSQVNSPRPIDTGDGIVYQFIESGWKLACDE